jgi:branched-chain amino acid transport system permease protein
MAEIIINILRQRMSSAAVGRVFGSSGLQLNAFLILLIAIIAASYGWHRFGKAQSARMRSRMSPGQLTVQRRISGGLLVLLLLILPSILGVYLTEIMNNVGLYILMGLGLNIAIGLAGLLDLGYVTNFAVGAYVMALLTSSSEYGLENPVPFWVAVPICIVAAMITGFVLALPVLRMRGDYLAIATLGFGEIIARLARSDALKPVIGGAQGILQIPKAQIGGALGQGMATILTPINNFLERFSLGVLGAKDGVVVFGTPPQLFYLLILACLLMLVISRRLNNSRTGRRWMAMREDEDVANAVGINTTNAKVIAFTLSAASGGLAGAIFAAKLGSIFPNSFQLLISVNVLSLIIVGGLGSIPGVIVGAFALIGVPELLREFAEFRLLLYGIALIVMMLVRPEGLWPSDVRRRELRGGEDPPPGVDGQEAVAVSAD